MRASQHHVIHVGVFCSGIQVVVGAALFRQAVLDDLQRLAPPERRLDAGRLRRHAGDVVHLDAARGCGRRAEMLVANQVGLELAVEHRDLLADHFAAEITQHAPVHHGLDLEVDFDQMGTQPILIEMKTPVRDLAGEHCRAGALAPFRIGSRADHGVAIHHRGGFHPGAVISLLRHVAREVGRAGLQDLHAAAGDVCLAFLTDLEALGRCAEQLPVVRIVAALQMAGMSRRLRHLDDLVAVQIEKRKNGVVVAAAMLVVVLGQKGIRRSGHPGDVVGGNQALRAQRFTIAHQKLHRLLPRLAVLAIQHGLLFVAQFHRLISGCERRRTTGPTPWPPLQ